jgi:CBS-domain-containing membrane protein
MTRERRLHITALSLLSAGVAGGAVCWALSDTAFWVVSGTAMVLVVVGLVFAGRASEEYRKRKKREQGFPG